MTKFIPQQKGINSQQIHLFQMTPLLVDLDMKNLMKMLCEKSDGQINSEAVIDKVALKGSRDVDIDEDSNKQGRSCLWCQIGSNVQNQRYCSNTRWKSDPAKY